MISSTAARTVLSPLLTGTDRDRQRKIGPSELGNLCQRCLAEKLLGKSKRDDRVSLAPVIGTAFHAYLEQVNADNQDVLTETKVTVGEIPGYGKIKGTMDAFVLSEAHGIDYKVMGMKRIAAMRRLFKLTSAGELLTDVNRNEGATLYKYWCQLNLYGKGMEDVGHKPERLSLVLFPRDDGMAILPNDVTELVFPYRRRVAERVLERAGSIYKWAIENQDKLDELPSDKTCFYCTRIRDITPIIS